MGLRIRPQHQLTSSPMSALTSCTPVGSENDSEQGIAYGVLSFVENKRRYERSLSFTYVL